MTTTPVRLLTLPVSNPVCVHDWQQDYYTARYICANCGYALSRLELMLPKEGDLPPTPDSA